MDLKKNMDIKTDITGMTHDGRGVGRYGNTVIFIPGCVKGETVTAHILNVKKNFAFGKLIDVIIPSPERIVPGCTVFGKCGGCVFGHISYEEELRIKYGRLADAVAKIGGIDIKPESIIPSPKTEAYRNKAQFPVGYSKDHKIISGFYAAHSHRIIECGECLIEPHIFSVIRNCVINHMNKFNVSAYDEVTGRGLVRHIFIRKAEYTGEISVCLVINGNAVPKSDELIFTLKKAVPAITGISLNINKEHSNVILGKKCVTIYGRDRIEDAMGGIKYEISPLSFYQVNSLQAERLYKTAAEYAALSGRETLLDMYCGTGTIGLFMAKQAERVIGVESVPQAIEDANRNAQINGIKNAEFICADAADAAKRLLESGCLPDTVILDPPRKGCDSAIIDSVSAMQPKRIVYVSCNPETLARDLKIFSEKGYFCRKIRPVDMFPRTYHVECVVLITRNM